MTRSGFIALVGEPNAGKSTLFNRIIGEKLAAITPKPQTTRFSLSGILTQPPVQYVFVDTPGWIASPKNTWHQLLNRQSISTLREADVVVWVLSGRKGYAPPPEEVGQFLQRCPSLLAAFTHADTLSPPERAALPSKLVASLADYPLKALLDASIDRPLEPLLEAVAAELPESPFLYPPDQITPLPVRFFAAEAIREQLYTYLREELPYGAEVEIVTYREEPERDFISATIHVEKASHKPMIIGEKGQMIKKIGTAARKEIESLIGKPVFLELHVKVSPRWRNSPLRLRSFGYRTS
jgi:GTP-binding protein Era